MVVEWWELGIIEPRSADDRAFPATAHVETERAREYPGDDPTLTLADAMAGLDSPVQPHVAGLAVGAPGAPLRPPKRSYGRGEV
jgi:hypothetical protein